VTAALFSTLPLSKPFLANLETMGYEQMTPIQEKSLPPILDGKDIIAQAKTGSGKTAAFAIGLLQKLNIKNFSAQSLVLCPTRELASQVAQEIRTLARYKHNIKVLTLCGGVSIGPQIGSLAHGAHILVGTPGRIQDHLGKKTLSLRSINTLVLDEADRMLDMGFFDAIEKIIYQTPKKRQTLLFSATYPEGIKALSAAFQNDPLRISVDSIHKDKQIRQLFYQVEPQRKFEALSRLLSHHKPASTVVFCNMRHQVREVNEQLQAQGYSSLALHGELEQSERDQVLAQFSNRSCSVLVATDVAARGLDIKDLGAVINYDLSRHAEEYVHRIGRTGRAGKEGLALSLLPKKEQYKLEGIEEYLGQKLERHEIEDLDPEQDCEIFPSMTTLCISGGRRNKVRPGDILGALTGDAGINGKQVGKIDIFDYHSYVAIAREVSSQALRELQNGKIKGRQFRVREL